MAKSQETSDHRTTDVLPEEAEVSSTKWSLASWVPKFPALPKYTGSFSVGCADLTWSYLKERQPFEEAEETATAQDNIRHMITRLYYPAEVTAAERTAKWLPSPSSVYAQGYGDFKKLPRWLSIPVVVGMLSFTSIHAFIEAKLPATGPFTNPAKKHQFPVVIFSHGLGGCRTTYSSICGEIASHGFVVCAIEHRDGTANASALPDTGKDTVTYRWPPVNDTDAEYQFRRGQLLFRVSEVQQTIQMLQRLNNGENIEEGKARTESESQFQNRLDFSNVVMAGHSFGAATTVETLRTEKSFFRCGILLDPWVFALEHESSNWRGGLVPTLDKPVLTINSEGFTNWKESFDILLPFLNANRERSRSPFLTVKESRHMNQSDFPILFRTVYGLKDKFSGKIDPEVAINLNNRAILQFLRNTVVEFGQFLPNDEQILSKEPSLITH
ncbi:hypothetical protein K493DRAFT_319532 [Basidiobolus meristosporus CBS 931.73]|uniref:Putative phospholipase n=1 Tax=Basidiobolus meristosporus CBS 931.73 TaxID=1314790 RepID=A0A1Y1XRR2_9FUNG|nr:hypothetical protein K493DRAFT_319532 [Basidiobolus meristosporus CBS 931.73]|eukprot:ORX88355.1 hypothetical protein K493DRAFT_319532 [Basidiobolus meristosporus CBS 931.73]